MISLNDLEYIKTVNTKSEADRLKGCGFIVYQTDHYGDGGRVTKSDYIIYTTKKDSDQLNDVLYFETILNALDEIDLLSTAEQDDLLKEIVSNELEHG